MTTERCTFSDLRPAECAHCTGDTANTSPITWDTPTQLLAVPTPRPPRRMLSAAGLPVIGTNRPDQPLDIHDLIDELTRRHAHREPYAVRNGATLWTRTHVTPVPSLIDQLGMTAASSTGESGAGGYASRPAAHLESVDTLIHIDREAARWIRELGEDDPGDTAACVRKLHGLHASATGCGRTHAGRGDCCTAHAIEADVRRWWTQARIVTGWDSPAWRPDNTCPVCEKRGTLRVRLSAQSALCIDCRETWDASTIGLLADHIRHENHETVGNGDTAKGEGACA